MFFYKVFFFFSITLFLQSHTIECHVNQTLCGMFHHLYGTCLKSAITYKVYSTMRQETDYMCSIMSSVTNCLNDVTYLDLASNGLVNCTCIKQKFKDPTNQEQYRFYKPLARICADSELYPQLRNWLNITNGFYTKDTSIDYSTSSDSDLVYDLYCKNYGWYDWHTNVTQRNLCVGSSGADELLACYQLHGRNVSNHSVDDVRAISASLINCYLFKAAQYCTAEMKRMIAVFGINDMENSVDFENRLKVDEFFIEPDVKSCKRSNVGIVADRHIIPFQTQYSGPCFFTGDMICLKTKYFQINCVSTIVDAERNKTAIKSIRIKFYSDNLVMGHYVAENGTLSGLFTNNKRVLLSGDDQPIAFVANLDMSSVVLVEVQSRTYIEINVVNNTYSFLVRAPNDVLQLSYGLLRSNCLRLANETKLAEGNNSVCNAITTDPHFTGELAALRTMFIQICSYDVEMFQNEMIHLLKIDKFLHNIIDAVDYDSQIINDPLSILYMNGTTTTNKMNTVTTTSAAATCTFSIYFILTSAYLILSL